MCCDYLRNLQFAFGSTFDGGVGHLFIELRGGSRRRMLLQIFAPIPRPRISQKRPIPKMQGNVGGDAADQAVSYGVRERHEDDGDERGDSLPHILPVDFDDRFHHHHPDEDERGADGPWRDRRQERCERRGPESGN